MTRELPAAVPTGMLSLMWFAGLFPLEGYCWLSLCKLPLELSKLSIVSVKHPVTKTSDKRNNESNTKREFSWRP